MDAPNCVQEELTSIVNSWPGEQAFRPFEGHHVNGIDYHYRDGMAVANSESVRLGSPEPFLCPPTFLCPCQSCLYPPGHFYPFI